MCFVNTDAKYRLEKTPKNCLQEAKRLNKKIYLETCFQQCQKKLPLVASVDGILGVEAADTMKMIAI